MTAIKPQPPAASATSDLTVRLKAEAAAQGFELAGACAAVTPSGLHPFYAWLEAGYAGEMDYLQSRREAYHHPDHVLPGAKSLLLLAASYRTENPSPPQPGLGQGRVSRYAWGVDYHDVLRPRLHALCDWIKAEVPGANARGVVDTAPLLEREFAQLAGLGWVGKNTLILNKRLGSWLFLAAILTDVELAYDDPHAASHCGTCTACLDACPTDAFVEPYVLDSRRCISYLTIELRDHVPVELRSGMGDWILGCDICQEVCPWNRKAPVQTAGPFAPQAGMNPVDLAGLFALDDEAFRERFRDTPLWRPRRRGILRNAALALGNMRPANGTAALCRGLADSEPLIRAACVWALGQYATADAWAALLRHRQTERDPHVCTELAAALAFADAAGQDKVGQGGADQHNGEATLPTNGCGPT